MAQEQETDSDIGELENRLERLRILYEQYFMGIEKREPGIQRKDVERRIHQLRKTRFQSTASRFKFQTMVQRYNTLQQYWNRTCREIENGTYRRHVQRAARRLATDPPSDAGQSQELENTVDRAQVREAASKDLAAMLDEDIDLEAEMAGALADLEKSPPPAKNTLSSLSPKKETTRGHTSPTLHLGKASPLKSLTPDAKASISPRRSMSPKPKGLEPLIKSPTPGNPLAALGKPSPAAPALQKVPPGPDKIAPAKTTPASATPAKPAPPAAAQKAGPPPAPSLRPQAKRPAPAPTKDTGLSGERIKALHASYIEARKKTNASPVSYEKLEQNVRQTEQRLRQMHQGRQVDFEVSIKDGKAILKPRLK